MEQITIEDVLFELEQLFDESKRGDRAVKRVVDLAKALNFGEPATRRRVQKWKDAGLVTAGDTWIKNMADKPQRVTGYKLTERGVAELAAFRDKHKGDSDE